MRTRFVLAALVTGVTVAGSARAQTAAVLDGPGFDIGLRVGYALPFGKSDGAPGGTLSDIVSGHIPLVLEAGYRLNAAVTVGGFFQYGFAQVKDQTNIACGQGGVTCSGSVVRLGVQGIFRLERPSPFLPWFGVGAGYEWLGLDFKGPGGTASVGARGFEFITLQAGGEYRIAPQFGLGPFVSLSLGQYDSLSLTTGNTSMTGDITNKELHEWLQFGLRGLFSL